MDPPLRAEVGAAGKNNLFLSCMQPSDLGPKLADHRCLNVTDSIAEMAVRRHHFVQQVRVTRQEIGVIPEKVRHALVHQIVVLGIG